MKEFRLAAAAGGTAIVKMIKIIVKLTIFCKDFCQQQVELLRENQTEISLWELSRNSPTEFM